MMTTRRTTKPFKGTVLIDFEELSRSEVEFAAMRDGRSPTEVVRRVVAKWARKQQRERGRVQAERQTG